MKLSAQTLTLAILIGATLTAFPAQAADTGIPAQRFKPTLGRLDLWAVQSSRIDPGFSWLLGLDLNYAYKPLLLIGDDGAVRREVLADLLMADVGLSLGFLEWAELSLVLPAALSVCGQGLESTGRPDAAGLGDLRAGLKVNLLGKGRFPFGLGVAATLTAPTATDGFLGNDGLTVTPRLLLDVRLGRLLVAANVDYTWRGEAVAIANTTLDPELGVGLGGLYWLSDQAVGLMAEAQALTSARELFSDSAKNAMEVLAGVRLRPWALGEQRGPLDGLRIDLGAGPGVTEGVGTPLWRALLALAYAPIELGPPDRDGDGIPDLSDKCPDDPEDPDGFEDLDGCPDPDNDRDGIPDASDRCPDQPEDLDGFEDQDGCPELDNDGDGVPDDLDGAPLEPEDRDGYADEDGIPDPDNDRDGIPDSQDRCPDLLGMKIVAPRCDDFNAGDPAACQRQPSVAAAGGVEPGAAEDYDGFSDQDGCPDLDNDGDGIPDALDACPLEAEDRDGYQDEDGCPDLDNDGDGIPDTRDACPLVAEDIDGFSDGDGCPEPGKPVTRAVIAGRAIKIMEKVQFATGSAKILLKESGALLAEVTKIFTDNSWVKLVEVQGHTDDVGNDAYNLDLSQRRAQSVVDYLIAQGIAAERLQAKGYGESLPISSNKTSRGRAANRRVEFKILEGEVPTVVIEQTSDLVIGKDDAATDAAPQR